MGFYAHTATLPNGKTDPDQSHWQRLSNHLRQVGSLAKKFATPLGFAAEAELAGLLTIWASIVTNFRHICVANARAALRLNMPFLVRHGPRTMTDHCSPQPWQSLAITRDFQARLLRLGCTFVADLLRLENS